MKLLSVLLLVGLVSAQTGVWPPSSGGGGTTLPSTTAILKGNGTGGAVAATAGTDYQSVLGFTPVSTIGSYTNPAWIISLPSTKITGLAASATTDTTNAANIGSGTLDAARLAAALSSSTSINGTSIPAGVTIMQTIAHGSTALGTSSILSGACALVTVSAPGVVSTDTIEASFNGDPTSITGYTPSPTLGSVRIYKYPGTDSVNFKSCNPTSNTINPGAATLNWLVPR